MLLCRFFYLDSIVIPTIPMYNHIKHNRCVGGDENMAKQKVLSIKTIVAIGIGSALFVILGRFGSIPSGIPNTNIETTYALLALFSLLYGPFAGLFISTDRAYPEGYDILWIAMVQLGHIIWHCRAGYWLVSS